MPKRLVSSGGVTCVKPAVGTVVAGLFVEICEPPPGADSRIVVMEQTTGGSIGVWESGALARLTPKMEPGQFYAIAYTGKKEYGKGEGWTVEVDHYTDAKEIEAFLKSYKVQTPAPKPEPKPRK